jgi:hypothetical protein
MQRINVILVDQTNAEDCIFIHMPQPTRITSIAPSTTPSHPPPRPTRTKPHGKGILDPTKSGGPHESQIVLVIGSFLFRWHDVSKCRRIICVFFWNAL